MHHKGDPKSHMLSTSILSFWEKPFALGQTLKYIVTWSQISFFYYTVVAKNQYSRGIHLNEYIARLMNSWIHLPICHFTQLDKSEMGFQFLCFKYHTWRHNGNSVPVLVLYNFTRICAVKNSWKISKQIWLAFPTLLLTNYLLLQYLLFYLLSEFLQKWHNWKKHVI